LPGCLIAFRCPQDGHSKCILELTSPTEDVVLFLINGGKPTGRLVLPVAHLLGWQHQRFARRQDTFVLLPIAPEARGGAGETKYEAAVAGLPGSGMARPQPSALHLLGGSGQGHVRVLGDDGGGGGGIGGGGGGGGGGVGKVVIHYELDLHMTALESYFKCPPCDRGGDVHEELEFSLTELYVAIQRWTRLLTPPRWVSLLAGQNVLACACACWLSVAFFAPPWLYPWAGLGTALAAAEASKRHNYRQLAQTRVWDDQVQALPTGEAVEQDSRGGAEALFDAMNPVKAVRQVHAHLVYIINLSNSIVGSLEKALNILNWSDPFVTASAFALLGALSAALSLAFGVLGTRCVVSLGGLVALGLPCALTAALSADRASFELALLTAAMAQPPTAAGLLSAVRGRAPELVVRCTCRRGKSTKVVTSRPGTQDKLEARDYAWPAAEALVLPPEQVRGRQDQPTSRLAAVDQEEDDVLGR
jgi:hypothetical protein